MTNMQYPIPKQEYKVMVQCCTYNQSQYIEDTLKGFAIQQTDFPFICCVFDDASTDGEQEVLKRWIENHCNPEDVEVYDHPLTIILMAPDKNNPNCIYAVHLQKVNTWGKPEKREMMSHWERQCEYIALCEGDDYWTDTLKLQMQYDYLESHIDTCLTYTNYENYHQETKTLLSSKAYICDQNINKLLLDAPFLAPCTWMYRNDVKIIMEPWMIVGDFPLLMSCAINSKIAYLDKKTAVYRILSSSASHSKESTVRLRFRKGMLRIKEHFFCMLNTPFDVQYECRLKAYRLSILECIKSHDYDYLNEITPFLWDNFSKLSLKEKIILIISKIILIFKL